MAQTRALAPAAMSRDDVTAALTQLGVIEANQSEFNRIKVEGATFIINDVPHISNPKTGAPAFRARLVEPPIEYQAAWLTQEAANYLNRPNAADSFCKSYFDEPNQRRKYSEDGSSCEACAINPFVKREFLPIFADGPARKCQWKGDAKLQIVTTDKDGNASLEDPTIYTLSLSTTSMIEFKGTAREKVRGHIGDLNFVQKLADFGRDINPEAPAKGIADAFTALRIGAVIVDVSAVGAKSSDGARSYYVIRFEPVAILEADDLPALPAGGDDTLSDDLPF